MKVDISAKSKAYVTCEGSLKSYWRLDYENYFVEEGGAKGGKSKSCCKYRSLSLKKFFEIFCSVGLASRRVTNVAPWFNCIKVRRGIVNQKNHPNRRTHRIFQIPSILCPRAFSIEQTDRSEWKIISWMYLWRFCLPI